MVYSSLNPNKLQELYVIDDHLWLEQTINLLIDHQWEVLDVENLIEALRDLGRSQFNQVRSLLKQIMIHLLLLDYWQREYDYNHRHWQAEILNFRDDLKQNLTPSLKNKLSPEIDEIYKLSVRFVIRKTGMSARTFPQSCPYFWQQLLDEDWYPSAKK